MAMTGILRPGHVQLRVMELGPALHHYKEMVGLIETARDAEGRVTLRRVYAFEFSDDGQRRRAGSIVIVGDRLESLELEPFLVQ